MALGNILRDAREARGFSTNDVAEHTNMMVQIVEELENEDFHRIAAPIYGRGFLKLYAELLDIDVQPLIDEFMDIYTGKTVPVVQRKESVSTEIKRPVPMATHEEEQSQAEPVQQKVEIVAHQPVRNVESSAKPLSCQENQPSDISLPTSEKVTDPTPVPVEETEETTKKQNSQAASAESLSQQTSAPVEHAELETAAQNIPPEPGDDLFGADEPNLFNTSPLQERVAEARRLMEEKEEGKQAEEQQKKTSLHLGTKQNLPVFQIVGRMDKSYETKPKKKRESSGKENLSESISRACGEFFRKHRIRIPFNYSTQGSRTLFVYGAFGIIVLLFIFSGVLMIFKLTESPADKPESESLVAALSNVDEQKNSSGESLSSDTVPPPPDMYFD